MKFFRWYKSLGWRIAFWSLSAAVIPAALLAGDMMFLYHLTGLVVGLCIALMMPGGIFFLIMIGGPHGGGNKAVDAIAGSVLVLVNAIFYRLVFGAIAKYLRKRDGVTKLL